MARIASATIFNFAWGPETGRCAENCTRHRCLPLDPIGSGRLAGRAGETVTRLLQSGSYDRSRAGGRPRRAVWCSGFATFSFARY
jgi:hypothetical protein